jgi:hypothetical protein
VAGAEQLAGLALVEPDGAADVRADLREGAQVVGRPALAPGHRLEAARLQADEQRLGELVADVAVGEHGEDGVGVDPVGPDRIAVDVHQARALAPLGAGEGLVGRRPQRGEGHQRGQAHGTEGAEQQLGEQAAAHQLELADVEVGAEALDVLLAGGDVAAGLDVGDHRRHVALGPRDHADADAAHHHEDHDAEHLGAGVEGVGEGEADGAEDAEGEGGGGHGLAAGGPALARVLGGPGVEGSVLVPAHDTCSWRLRRRAARAPAALMTPSPGGSAAGPLGPPLRS